MVLKTIVSKLRTYRYLMVVSFLWVELNNASGERAPTAFAG